MNADELIESYVAEVAQLLPRKQRREVALELRALLHDELDAKAGLSNREDVARALLTGFGRPADIDPADTRRFLTLSVAGVALILLGGLLRVLTQPAEQGRELGEVLPQAWMQLFAWQGFLVIVFAMAAWVRRRWPHTAVWKPRPVSSGRISRPGRAAMIVFFILGVVVLVNPAWWVERFFGGRATSATYAAFAYDEDFLRLRGPILLGLIGITIALQVILLMQGRWHQRIVARDGAAALTMRALAAEAQCAVGMPYKIFVNREELIASMVQAELAQLLEEFGKLVANAGHGTVGANLGHYAELLLNSPAITLGKEITHDPAAEKTVQDKANDLRFGDALESTVARYLAAEKKLGRVRTDVDEKAFGFLIAGAVHNLLVSPPSYPHPTLALLKKTLAAAARSLTS